MRQNGMRQRQVEPTVPPEFEPKLQNQFHVAEFMPQTSHDRLGRIGKLLSPTPVESPVSAAEILVGFAILNQVRQRTSIETERGNLPRKFSYNLFKKYSQVDSVFFG